MGICTNNTKKINKAIANGVQPAKNTLDLAIQSNCQSVIEATLESPTIRNELTIDRFITLIKENETINILKLLFCENFKLSSIVFNYSVSDPFEQLKIVGALNKKILETAIERDPELKAIIALQNKEKEIFGQPSAEPGLTVSENNGSITLAAACGLLKSSAYTNDVLTAMGEVLFEVLKKQRNLLALHVPDKTILAELGRMYIDSLQGEQVTYPDSLPRTIALFLEQEGLRSESYFNQCNPLPEIGLFAQPEASELDAYVNKYKNVLNQLFTPCPNFNGNKDDKMVMGRNISSILSVACKKLQPEADDLMEKEEKESNIEFFQNFAQDGGLTASIKQLNQLNTINFNLTDFITPLSQYG